MSKKKELDLEDLENVTGGTLGSNNLCLFFIQAQRMPAENCCNNCLYYNQVNENNNEKECTHSMGKGFKGGI